MGSKIETEDELEALLSGDYKDTERTEEDEDWYWENVEINDLYGYVSHTMIDALFELKKENQI